MLASGYLAETILYLLDLDFKQKCNWRDDFSNNDHKVSKEYFYMVDI